MTRPTCVEDSGIGLGTDAWGISEVEGDTGNVGAATTINVQIPGDLGSRLCAESVAGDPEEKGDGYMRGKKREDINKNILLNATCVGSEGITIS